MKTHKVILLVALGLGIGGLAYPRLGHAATPPQTAAELEVFVRQGCLRCAAAERFLADLQQEWPALEMVVHDLGQDPAALGRLQELAAGVGVQPLGVPAFYVRGELLIGYLSAETTGARLKALLASPGGDLERIVQEEACPADAPLVCPQEGVEPPAERETVDAPFFGRLSVRALGLPLFTLILGFLDGLNPCAMWVLLLLLSLLVHVQDRAKMLLIGGTFVAVSGLVYFAIMAAWLNFFLLVGLSRATQVGLGGFAVLVGTLNIKDFLAFGRGVSLSIPAVAKPGMYARVRRILQAEHLPGALAGVIVLAVLVNTIEILCTAGLPAVYTRMLTLRQLPWWAYYGYLGLYNVAYMLDDSIILMLAVVTLGRRKLQEKEGRWLKLLSGAVMLGLGIVLLVQPAWLMG